MEAAIRSKADMARQTKVGMHHCVSLATRCRTIREGCPLRWHGPGSDARGGCGQGRGGVQYPVASTCARGLGQRTRKTGHKNQTWHPELRIETRDPDRIWIVCFFHDTDFDHNRSRARKTGATHQLIPPPHTKAHSIINPVPLLPQPSGSKQQGTWVLLF